MKTKNIFKFLVIVFIHYSYGNNYVEEVFKWRKVEYENLPKSENYRIGPYKYYIPENNDISGFAYHPASGLMVTVNVRHRPGIPSSLNAFCVNEYTVGSSPKIWGFPNYKVNALRTSDFYGKPDEEDETRTKTYRPNKPNKGQNYYPPNYNQEYYTHNKPGNYNIPGSYNFTYPVPIYTTKYTSKPTRFTTTSTTSTTQRPPESTRIISVFHVTIDEKCNRLFVVDNGRVNYYLNSSYIIKKPSLIVVDLPTDGCESRVFSILRNSEIPDKIIANRENGFMHTFVDHQSEKNCDDLFVYMPNSFYNYLVVYSYKTDEFWSFDHETFQPVVSQSHFVFDKTLPYDFNFGIFSIALGYPDKYGDRTAYYTSIASTAQFAVSTQVLKDKRRAMDNFNSGDFRIMGFRGCHSQTLKTVIDYTSGVMFYTEVDTGKIRCWDMNKDLNPNNVDVIYTSDDILFNPQIFIDSRKYLWFQTNQIPLLYASDKPLDPNNINCRIYQVKVSDAIEGTLCGDLYKT
ncbi:Major royal jelly protein/protein yellow [Sergentomyia squamirostris]